MGLARFSAAGGRPIRARGRSTHGRGSAGRGHLATQSAPFGHRRGRCRRLRPLVRERDAACAVRPEHEATLRQCGLRVLSCDSRNCGVAVDDRAGAHALRLAADHCGNRSAEPEGISLRLDRQFGSAQTRQPDAGKQHRGRGPASTRELSGIASVMRQEKLPTVHEYHLTGCMTLCAAGVIVSGILLLLLAYTTRADWNPELEPTGYMGNVARGAMLVSAYGCPSCHQLPDAPA